MLASTVVILGMPFSMITFMLCMDAYEYIRRRLQGSSVPDEAGSPVGPEAA